MPERNASIAAVLEEIADLLDIQGANAFRVRAYRNAARSIAELNTEIQTLQQGGQPLTEITGVGTDLAQKIGEILNTGTCEFLETLRKQIAPGITQLLKIPALGPRRVRTLYETLHIESLEGLLAAAQAGKIRELPGFGEKTERRILQTAQSRIAMARRYPLAVAAQFAEPLATHLRAIQGVQTIDIAGSYRRMRASVGDIDIVAIAGPSSPVMDRFIEYGGVTQVLSKGPTRSSVLIEPGLQVDLRSVAAASFGAAMVYFTGSKAHNIAIRRMGQERGLKINEYGVFREGGCVAGDTEESVYAAIDLPWIAPELREDRGEIAAAQHRSLPRLVQHSDICGEPHARFGTVTDARQLVAQAASAGLQYLGFVVDARGDERYGPARAQADMAAISELAGVDARITVFNAIEVGYDVSGRLTVPQDVLKAFRFVVASPHGALDLSATEQTRRMLSAIEAPHVAVLAAPSAAQAGTTFEIDGLAVARAAVERSIAIEVSLHPDRCPWPDTFLTTAREHGARFLVSAQPVRPHDLDVLQFSVGFARRAGCAPTAVLNASGLEALDDWLASRLRST